MSYDKMQIFRDLILILLSTKILGIAMRRIKVPEVVGALLAGVIIGPTLLNLVHPSTVLDIFAEIGVVLIMFSAGTETNLKQIKESGKASVIITAFGVVVPFALGYVVASLFNGGFNVSSDVMIANMFYGVMLTATSVTITVATLKELGKLSTRVGTSILSAAVLDDIIGIIILTVFIGLKDPSVDPVKICINIVLFFIFAIIAGLIIRKCLTMLENRFHRKRRMVIVALIVCFAFSYVAEEYFGLADITGAFFAGIVFSDLKDSKYLEHRLDISSYMIFSPVFFASIGVNTVVSNINMEMVWFGLCFVIVGLLSKFIGCSFASKISGFTNVEALRVGLGMMTRAEVILITAQKGIDAGFLKQEFMPFVIMVVIISSFATPIFMKMSYKKELAEATAE